MWESSTKRLSTLMYYQLAMIDLLEDKNLIFAFRDIIFTSERAMTKLYKEANRVKQILSANTDTIASVSILAKILFQMIP